MSKVQSSYSPQMRKLLGERWRSLGAMRPRWLGAAWIVLIFISSYCGTGTSPHLLFEQRVGY